MLREVLENVGFKPKFPETHKNPSAKGTRSKSPTKSPSNSRQTTPKRSVSPKPASPAKPQLTEFQKKDCEFIFEFIFLLNSHGNLDYDLLMISLYYNGLNIYRLQCDCSQNRAMLMRFDICTCLYIACTAYVQF